MVIPIDAVRCGMGFDETGRWHEAKARWMNDDGREHPGTSARGLAYGLLFSSILWTGLVVSVRFLIRLV